MRQEATMNRNSVFNSHDFNQLGHASLTTNATNGDAIAGDDERSMTRGRQRRRSKRYDHNQDDETAVMMRRKLTDEQAKHLEMSFGDEHKLESHRKERLASELGLDPRQVAVWFQNRRARWKHKTLEEEYNKLKAAHEGTITLNSQLEAQVVELREQLCRAEEEKQSLHAERVGSSGTTNTTHYSFNPSTFSTELVCPPLLGELGLGRSENIFDLCDTNYIHEFEWINLHGYGL
ncbi:hypothetical protein Scep_000783 [Stephania cephalantha]|uniref:Homeobox-leucine zipper protein n=1 Tax=Stephania cephalantha TaxID=152367 RepID=A0AAP0Q2R4_9MAGN